MTNCTHMNATKIFTIGECNVYAANKDEARERLDWALMVCLAGTNDMFKPKNILFPNEKAAAMLPEGLKTMEIPPLLCLDWADGGVPPLNKKWWKLMLKTLKGLKGDVVFYCHGGHGRTGTAMSILCALAGKVPGKADPVEYVRKLYCMKACETNGQLDYVQAITGREVKVDASRAVTTVQGTQAGLNYGIQSANLGSTPVGKTQAPSLPVGGSGAGAKTKGNSRIFGATFDPDFVD